MIAQERLLKKVVTKLQGNDLLRKMLLSSKMDKVLLSGFKFDGFCKQYLCDLEFSEARAIFMARYRMLPTKSNYPGRWDGTLCNACGREDLDEHIYSCPGYCDIVDHEIRYDMLLDDEVLKDINLLRKIAGNVQMIIERMEDMQRIPSIQKNWVKVKI